MLKGPVDKIILASSEVVRSTWWELELSSPSGEMPQDCQYKLRDLPALSDKVDAVPYSPVNSQVLYPGMKKAAGSTDIKIHLYDGDSLYNFFKEWYKMVYDEENDAVGLYSEVVGQGSLKLYSAGDEEPTLSKTIKLVDVWPSSMTLSPVSRDGDGEPLTYIVTLEVTEISED